MAEKGRGRSRGVDGGGSSGKPRRNITPTPGYRNRTANFISVISPLSAERPALFHLTLGGGQPRHKLFF